MNGLKGLMEKNSAMAERVHGLKGFIEWGGYCAEENLWVEGIHGKKQFIG